MNQNDLMRILGFGIGYWVVVADIGNALAKLAAFLPESGDHREIMTWFTHAIVEINEAEYERLCRYYEGRRADHLIKIGRKFYIVGDEAYSFSPSFEPLRGRAKYQPQYYGVLFISGLLRLFGGNLPENISVFLAHPPADEGVTTELMKSVFRTWNFESNGTKYTTTVAYANTVDEIVGGIFAATTAPDGRPYEEVQIIGDGPTFVFDGGGGSIDYAAVKRDGSVDYEKPMLSLRTGANSAINNFKGLFEMRYKKLVIDSEDGISRGEIIDVFLDKDHAFRHAGERLDCKDIYTQATNPIIREAKDGLKRFGGLRPYNRVLLTGGLSGLLYDRLAEELFETFLKNKVLHVADQRPELFKANARGIVKMVPGMVQQSKAAFKRAGGRL